jgi:hypothetical protein
MVRKLVSLLVLTVVAHNACGQSAPSIGIEANWTQAMAAGRYISCGCGEFDRGKGTGGNAAFVFSIPFKQNLTFNLSAGYTTFGANYSRTAFDTAVIFDPSETDSVMAVTLKNIGSWHAAYLAVAPELEFHATTSLHLLAAPEIGVFLGGRERFEHQLPDSSDIRFQSTGTRQEILGDQPIRFANNLTLAFRVGVGYEVNLGSVRLMPEAEAVYSLTSIFSQPNTAVNVLRFLGGLRVMYQLGPQEHGDRMD